MDRIGVRLDDGHARRVVGRLDALEALHGGFVVADHRPALFQDLVDPLELNQPEGGVEVAQLALPRDIVADDDRFQMFRLAFAQVSQA